MRFFAHTTLALLFSVLVNNALQAQELPCDIKDPLVTVGAPALFGDPCCGAFIEGYTVCYDIEGWFAEVESTWQGCGEIRLLRFHHLDSVYVGSYLIENAADLANALNNILTGAGFSDFAVFEAEDSTFSVCADTIASNEFFQLTIKCGNDTIQITPAIEEINSCPVDLDLIESAYDGIINRRGYSNMELFHIDNTVTNVGNIVLDTLVSGGSITTSDLLDNFSWGIHPDSTINSNALPSEEEVGHLLNAVFGSGLMSSPCMDVNINCMIDSLLQITIGHSKTHKIIAIQIERRCFTSSYLNSSKTRRNDPTIFNLWRDQPHQSGFFR